MRVKPCPCCKRMPKIYDCVPDKVGIRRRIICCPNDCPIITIFSRVRNSWFVHEGNEDDNTLFKEWNERVSHYNA